MADLSGWGKGAASATKTEKDEKPGILGRVRQEAGEFVGVIPKLPGVAMQEVASMPVVGDPVKAVWKRVPGLKGVVEEGERREAEALERLSKAKGLGEKAIAAGDLPGLRLLPGTYTVPRLFTKEGRSELALRPLSATLDVLPEVGAATRAITKGTRAGRRLTREAADHAALVGHTGTAQKMTEQGLSMRQAALALGRRGERAFQAKHPQLEPYTPSRLLEASGIGGERLRRMMEMISVGKRKAEKEFSEFTDEVAKSIEDANLTPERVGELTQLMERGEPGWREALTAPERQWLDFYQTKTRDLLDKGLKTGKIFEWQGEIYSVADAGRLSKAVLAMQASQANAVKASAHKSGLFKKMTSDEWLDLAEEWRETANKRAVRTPPARFHTALHDKLRTKVSEMLKREATEKDFAEILTNTHAELSRAQVQRAARDIGATWHGLRKAGFDPVWVHHISPDQAKRLAKPDLLRPVSPGELKRRLWYDMRPSVPDANVALSAQALDWLQLSHTQRLLEAMSDAKLLRDRKAVSKEIINEVARKHGDNHPQLKQMAGELLAQRWTEFDPQSLFPLAQGKLGAKEGLVVPASLVEGLKRAAPKQWSQGRQMIHQVAGAPIKTFRHSVLTFNPFYYIGNFLSGAIMAAVVQSPAVWRQGKKAWQAVKQGTAPIELVGSLRKGSVEMADAAYHYAGGRSLGRILHGKQSGWSRHLRHPITALHAVSQQIDDMWKVASYFEEAAKQTKKGMSAADAHELGLRAAEEVLGNFDRLTMLERSAVRNVMPFYAWWKFIGGYMLKLPFDHPLRASMTMALARAEFEDWPEGLPQRFRSYLMIGDTGIPTGWAFPFVSTPNSLTLAGLMSRLNPAVQASLEQLGLDPFTFGPELYPELDIDPYSGREVINRPSPGAVFARSFLPQIETVEALLGTNEDLRRLREENPEAYTRMLLRETFGAPVPRKIDVVEEQTKTRRAESRAKRSQRRAQTVSPSPAGGPLSEWGK